MKAQLNGDSQTEHRPAAVALRPQSEAESPDSALINILVENRGYFLRYLQSRLSNRDDAEDIFQDFQLRVLTKASQIKDTGSAMAWLRAVCRSVLADHFRRTAVERHAHQAYRSERPLIFPQEESVAEDDPSGRYACKCFYRLLPLLKEEYTDVLSRVDLAEQSRADAADDLGISASNLRVRLHRARQALRDALQYSCPQCHERKCFDPCRSEVSTIGRVADERQSARPVPTGAP